MFLDSLLANHPVGGLRGGLHDVCTIVVLWRRVVLPGRALGWLLCTSGAQTVILVVAPNDAFLDMNGMRVITDPCIDMLSDCVHGF